MNKESRKLMNKGLDILNEWSGTKQSLSMRKAFFYLMTEHKNEPQSV